MKRLTNILVHVDTRTKQSALLARAVELAKLHGAAVKVVDIVPEFSWPVRLAAPDYDEIRQSAIRQKELAIQELVAEMPTNDVTVTSRVLCGKSSDQIIGEVVRGEHDLVMKDAKGQFSQQPGAFGRTAMRLIRYCPCPVWAHRPPRSDGPRQMVIAVDATATDDPHQALNRNILEWGTAIAGDAPPHIAHVWSVYGESLIKDYMKRDELESMVREAESEAREQLSRLLQLVQIPASDSHVHLLRGDPTAELTKFVNEGGYDALVMGTVARTGITGMLIGNTAESLLNLVQCSVIAIKPTDFKSPIQVA